MLSSFKRLFSTGLLALLLAGAGPASAAEPIPVVASFSLLGDIVTQVGGDRVRVSTLVGADADAHEFQPTPADVKTIAGARLVVINGLGFEGWIERLVRNAAYKGPLLVVSKDVVTRKIAGTSAKTSAGTGKPRSDPHIWQDPLNVAIEVRNIEEALVRLDPLGAPVYKANAERYRQALEEFDDWARAQFETVGPARRVAITSHDAFGYLGDHYGVRFLSPQGLSTASEASARDVAMLVRQIKRERIKAVFMENMSNPVLIEQLARDTGVKLGAPLYADALSKPSGPAPTYLKMMRYNVEALMKGLQQN